MLDVFTTTQSEVTHYSKIILQAKKQVQDNNNYFYGSKMDLQTLNEASMGYDLLHIV